MLKPGDGDSLEGNPNLVKENRSLKYQEIYVRSFREGDEFEVEVGDQKFTLRFSLSPTNGSKILTVVTGDGFVGQQFIFDSSHLYTGMSLKFDSGTIGPITSLKRLLKENSGSLELSDEDEAEIARLIGQFGL